MLTRTDGIASTSADVAVNMGCVFSRSELLAGRDAQLKCLDNPRLRR